MPSVTPQEICSNLIFCLQNTLCFRNYPVPMLLWTGKLKGGWECTPKEIPCKEGMDFQILNSSALIEPRLHTIAGCWWMAKEPLQSNSSWCFLKLFFGLWALTAPPTPPYVTHSRDTYTMRGEEQGQVHDPGGSGIPDSVCSSRPQIAPFLTLKVNIEGFLHAKASERRL